MKPCELIALATGHIAYCVYVWVWRMNREPFRVPTANKTQISIESSDLKPMQWPVTIEYEISQDARMCECFESTRLFLWCVSLHYKKESWFWNVKMTVKHIQKKSRKWLSNTHLNDIELSNKVMNRMKFYQILYLMQIRSNQIAWSTSANGHCYWNFKFNFNFILIKFIYIQFNMVTVPVSYVFSSWQIFISLHKMAKPHIQLMDHRFYLGTW